MVEQHTIKISETTFEETDAEETRSRTSVTITPIARWKLWVGFVLGLALFAALVAIFLVVALPVAAALVAVGLVGGGVAWVKRLGRRAVGKDAQGRRNVRVVER